MLIKAVGAGARRRPPPLRRTLPLLYIAPCRLIFIAIAIHLSVDCDDESILAKATTLRGECLLNATSLYRFSDLECRSYPLYLSSSRARGEGEDGRNLIINYRGGGSGRRLIVRDLAARSLTARAAFRKRHSVASRHAG